MTHAALRRTCAACALLSLAAPAGAQTIPDPEVFDLGEIVLSANLEPTEEERAGATVEVIEAEELETAPVDALSTLDRQPGVSISQSGPLGATGTLRIRGLGSEFIGVRIDGIDVADPSAPQTEFDFGQLTTFGIDRVEVVRGSQSALYGSEAIGGVVDIFSDVGGGLGTSAETRFEAGSFDTYAAALGVAHGTERGRLSFNLSRVESDGFSAQSNDGEDDGFEQTFFTTTGSYDASDTLTVGFSAFWRDSELEFDNSFDPDPEQLLRSRAGRIYAELETGIVDHLFAASYFEVDRDFPGDFPFFAEGVRRQYEYLATVDLSQDLSVSAGLDRTEESFQDNFGGAGDLDTNSVFTELRWRPIPVVDTSFALRYDNVEGVDDEVSGRFAAAWQATPDTTVRGVIGTGFRAPSANELFSSSGNPGLESETSRSVELGVERRFGPVAFLEATAFYTEIDDRISFDSFATFCGSGFGCSVQFPGTTFTRGIELSGAVPLGDRALLFGNYTYTNADLDGVDLALVPQHDLNLGIEAELADRLRGTLDIQYVADVDASGFAPADNEVDDYFLVGAGLAYDVTDTAEAYIRIENLTDDEYETVGGFNTADRSYFVGIRASF